MVMSLSEDLLKMLNKKYEPSTMIHFRYRANDIAIQTDGEGTAIRMFIGKFKEDGFIKGERYNRTIKKDHDGAVIKDYWERKGRAT
jgi:hypothetical protein